jgi:hypothetical protein
MIMYLMFSFLQYSCLCWTNSEVEPRVGRLCLFISVFHLLKILTNFYCV